MKTIGMIGGMSWESTLEYYRLLNEGVKQRLGGLHSAKCLLYSVDFSEIEELQRKARWEDAGARMANAARSLERGGADFILLCTNTMHKLASQIETAVSIPFLHIADPTAARIQSAGLRTIGLLGTRFTMEENFYKGRLENHFELNVLTPPPAAREAVHRIIYDELCLGITRAESRALYNQVISDLAHAGAEAIILGCTEIGLLVRQEDSPLPLFDTTFLHAQAAIDYALT